MCTLVVLYRPGHAWPLLLAGNRDELKSRPWKPPGRHWPQYPDIIAGLDQQAGGSWFGINRHAVVAAINNRAETDPRTALFQSRGQLVLAALKHDSAPAAIGHFGDFPKSHHYQPFNLFIGDRRHAFWLRYRQQTMDIFPLSAGLHMLTALDMDDPDDPRIRHHLPRFRSAEVPDPAGNQWRSWRQLMADRHFDAADGPTAAMTVSYASGFETLCSHLLALPSSGTPLLWFSLGPPDRATYLAVDL